MTVNITYLGQQIKKTIALLQISFNNHYFATGDLFTLPTIGGSEVLLTAHLKERRVKGKGFPLYY